MESDTQKTFTTLTYGNGPGHTAERIDAAQQNTSELEIILFFIQIVLLFKILNLLFLPLLH